VYLPITDQRTRITSYVMDVNRRKLSVFLFIPINKVKTRQKQTNYDNVGGK